MTKGQKIITAIIGAGTGIFLGVVLPLWLLMVTIFFVVGLLEFMDRKNRRVYQDKMIDLFYLPRDYKE